MKKNFKNDMIVLTVILAAAFLFWFVPRLFTGGEAVYVRILQDGQETERYLLSEDRTITIPSGDGGYNLLLISDGKVDVTDSNCPNRLCVKRRPIRQSGESIICLPHRLVVEIISREETPDGVAY